jgi:predicted glutamine amidotransferase
MCVIVYLPEGIKANKEDMENCFFANSDGAGFMYQDRKHSQVIIKKGYMTFDSFWREFSGLPWNVDRVAHFRIATSGKVDEGCCHPFPVCKDYKEMRRLRNKSKLAVAHNGVIHWATPTDGLKSKFSDTMAFIAGYVEPMRNLIFRPEIGDIIQHATNSKFAVMSPESVTIIGDFEMHNGGFFSNDSYLDYVDYYSNKYDKKYGGCYSNYFDKRERVYTILVNSGKEKADWDLADKICVYLEEHCIEVADYWVVNNYTIEYTVDKLPILKSIYGYTWYEPVWGDETNESNARYSG